MACTQFYNSLIDFWNATPSQQYATADGTLTVQHASTGEVQYVSGQLSHIGNAFEFDGSVFDSASKFQENKSYTWSVTIGSDGTVAWTSKFGKYTYAGDCSLHAGFLAGTHVTAMKGPGQGDAFAMLSVTNKRYLVKPPH